MRSACILCYHKVGPVEREGRFLNVSPERLESHVRHFKRRGWSFLRGCDLASSWPERTVVFTFDDAYESALEHAPAILERHDARATFYAVAGLVGDASRWDGPIARPLASWEALVEVQRAGHEVGNHTSSHPRLAELEPEAQREEVARCHRALVERGLQPGSFCYPYGSIGGVDAIRELYPIALAVDRRMATPEDDRLRLPRIVIAYSDALPMLLYKMYVRPRLR